MSRVLFLSGCLSLPSANQDPCLAQCTRWWADRNKDVRLDQKLTKNIQSPCNLLIYSQTNALTLTSTHPHARLTLPSLLPHRPAEIARRHRGHRSRTGPWPSVRRWQAAAPPAERRVSGSAAPGTRERGRRWKGSPTTRSEIWLVSVSRKKTWTMLTV